MPATWRVYTEQQVAEPQASGCSSLRQHWGRLPWGTFWAGDSSQGTSEPPRCQQGCEGEAGEAAERGAVPGAGAHPRHESGPKAGGGSTLAPGLCGSCGQTWKAGGIWPQA